MSFDIEKLAEEAYPIFNEHQFDKYFKPYEPLELYKGSGYYDARQIAIDAFKDSFNKAREVLLAEVIEEAEKLAEHHETQGNPEQVSRILYLEQLKQTITKIQAEGA